MVVTGTATITESAAGGGAANVASGSSDSVFIVSIQNIPQLRNHFTHAGTALGQAFSYAGAWKVDFSGGAVAARFEEFPLEEQGSNPARLPGNCLEPANSSEIRGKPKCGRWN